MRLIEVQRLKLRQSVYVTSVSNDVTDVTTGRVIRISDVIVLVDMATACSVVMANDVADLGSSSVGLRGHTATNCILMTVAVVSICALVVCGVLVVREYSLAMSYLPTRCRISDITYANDVVCKHCASGQC